MPSKRALLMFVLVWLSTRSAGRITHARAIPAVPHVSPGVHGLSEEAVEEVRQVDIA